MMVAKFGCTRMTECRTCHLFLKIPKVHSTKRLALGACSCISSFHEIDFWKDMVAANSLTGQKPRLQAGHVELEYLLLSHPRVGDCHQANPVARQ